MTVEAPEDKGVWCPLCSMWYSRDTIHATLSYVFDPVVRLVNSDYVDPGA